MTLGELQEIFTFNIARLISYAEANGYKCRLREVERTAYQQAEYLRTGKSKTNDSQHLKSLAADIYFTKGGKLIEGRNELIPLGVFWESLYKSNRWGGNYKSFVDCPHFEMAE
jgi:peptidoglycan L-alanyl-D-glutamate endopeptidase CwlK